MITDKSKKRGSFRTKIVARIAREIAEAKKKKDFDLIIVHGAGAYPHYLTTKYKIVDGLVHKKSAFGFSHIKNELFKLNNLVWDEFLKVGLNVCTVQPSTIVFTRNGKIKKFNTQFIESLLKIGVIPMLMGDDTIDEIRGISVFSGDKILPYLGRKFNADQLIFISDVDGVYSKNPKVHKEAKRIKVIDDKNFQSVISSIELSNKYDSSGEMKGKLMALSDNCRGFSVRILSGFVKNNVGDVLLGKELGTKIILS